LMNKCRDMVGGFRFALPALQLDPHLRGNDPPEADRESEGVPQRPFPSPKSGGQRGLMNPMPILAGQPIEVVMHGTG
jgi:hypothetical protein